MSILDRAIEFVSPKWAAERDYYRAVRASYKGGIPTRTSEWWSREQAYRLGSSSDRQQLASARDRAFQAYKNNPIARTLIQTETDNVIGDGLNYQPETESKEWNDEATDRYYEWLENCSLRGGDIQDGCDFQRMAWARSRVGGDAGWVLVNRDSDYGIESRVQLIGPANIGTPDNLHGDPGVFDGIRYDPTGAPRAFYILSQDDRGKRSFTEVGARDFVYLPHMTDTDQARGETCYLTIFDLLAHLDRYVDGVSLAAWMATVMSIIFKQNNSAKQLNALTTLTNSQGVQQKAITFENGMVKYIGTDEDVAQVQAQQPMQQTPEFIRTMFRMLGQPFDMPLEVIAKDMSTCTFASARIGLLPFYRSCRIKAAKFGSHWSRTIRWWLSRERMRAVGDPQKWTTKFPQNYWKHSLLVNAWDYTDPVSEAQADLLQMDMLTKSPQMIIAERGRNAERMLKEFVEWKEKTSDLTSVRSSMTRDGAGVSGPDPELERIKAETDAYGVGVRAGRITPQPEDEKQMRQQLKLPTMTPEAMEAWEKDKGVRRPITLVPPEGSKPAPGFQQSNTDNGDVDDNATNRNGKAPAISRISGD